MKKYSSYIVIIFISTLISCKNTSDKLVTENNTMNTYYKEAYRPQYHFSPKEKWMNDPNGLVYNDGVYHLFYQYYPDDIVWGPMHWGHAVSEDMVYWKHKPIALFPDEHGLIFSGSAVVDKNNTSGLGTQKTPPMIAVFTYHLMEGEEAGREDYQTQGIAYSLDNGDSWVKYEGNPVIPNNGIKDFRDPKVFWNNLIEEWTMLLVAGDHLQIWHSKNLIDWEKGSEFGKEQGAHGGVWECPDLFPLQVEGTDEEKWVLFISINPGAPNGGSGTQYFVGDFDGKTFTSNQKEYRWVDEGTDNYAGVTYNNIPNDDRVFIGWMSNWEYARDTPTQTWRSAMTVPQKLSMRKIGDTYELMSYPVEALDKIIKKGVTESMKIGVGEKQTWSFPNLSQSEVTFTSRTKDMCVTIKNNKDEKVVLTVNATSKKLTLDRSTSGKVDFNTTFGQEQLMVLDNLPDEEIEYRILLDWSSVEVFVNKGQYVMTAQLFPNTPYTILEIENTSEVEAAIKDFSISEVKSIW